MDTLVGRLRKFIEYENISVRKFEQKIECTTGIIQKVLSKNTDLSSKWVSNIAQNFPNLSAEWLLTGRGPMLKSDKKAPNSVGEGNISYSSTKNAVVNGHVTGNGNKISSSDLSDTLKLLAKKDEQIDKLLAIIEKLTIQGQGSK